MTQKYLKHKIIIVFLFFLFVVIINQHIYKEGNTESSQFTERELQQQKMIYDIVQSVIGQFSDSQREQHSIINQYIEAKVMYEVMILTGKEFISKFNTFREKILTLRNRANDLLRQAAMAKERNQPNWIEFSNHLINLEKNVRIELDTLLNKYTDDIKIINEILFETENARIRYTTLEKEIAKL